MWKNKNIFYFLIIILLGLPLLLPLFHSGFFSIHDNAQIQRTYEMAKGLQDGMFPVRWSEDLGYGYGYPIFNFYAPYIYYLSASLYLLGFSAIVATKIILGLGIILSGMGMFLLTKKYFSLFAAFFAAAVYMYAPYHALDLYVRGDLSEAFAYSLIPFVFYFIGQSIDSPKRRWIIGGSISMALLIITHNLTAIMILPFLVAFILISLYQKHKKKSGVNFAFIAIFFISVLLSAFYWLPTFTEMKFTNVYSVTQNGSNYHEHYVCLSQLWDSPWGYGGSTSGCINDGISFRIGKLAVILSLVAVIGSFIFMRFKKYKSEVEENFVLMISCFLGVIFCVFLMLPNSQFIWDSLPFMAYFQFPWRFLIMVVFLTSILASANIYFIQLLVGNQKQKILGMSVITIIGVITVVGINLKLFHPQRYIFWNDSNYLSKSYLVWDTSRISDEYLSKFIQKPKSKSEALSYQLINSGPHIKITSIQQTTTRIEAAVVLDSLQTIVIHLNSFPVWNVFVDGQKVMTTNMIHGIAFPVPPGQHVIDVKYIATPVETLSNILSVFGFLCLFIPFGIVQKKKR